MTDQLSLDLASLRIDRSTRRPASRWWRRILVASLLLGSLGAAAHWGPSMVEARLFKTAITSTEVSSISPAQASIDLTATGYLIPQLVAKVGAKVTGRLVAVNVTEGSVVQAGAVMFALDPTDEKSSFQSAQAQVGAARARAEVARANLEEAKVRWERTKRLVAGGAAPAADAEDAEVRYKALAEQVRASDAEARASAAQAGVISSGFRNLTIPAPISGTVVTKPSQLGEVVNPSVVLAELVDFSSLLVETDVPEAKLGLIKKGGPCEVVLDALPNQRLRAAVVEFGPRLNRAKATGTVKVKLIDSPDIVRPDMSARVSFLSRPLDEKQLAEAAKSVVPGAALVDHAGGKAVYVVEEGHVRLVPVTLGASFGSGFELKSGPAPGTKLVKDPPIDLADGQQVKEKSE